MILERAHRKVPLAPAACPKSQAVAANTGARLHLDKLCGRLVLPLAGLLGLVLVVACVSVLVRFEVPLPRCAFKTVTGLPCFTCGSTRALFALGQFQIARAFKFNPLVTLACATVPIWLGASLINKVFGPRLRFQFAPRLKSILFWLAAAGILNWIYLLLALPE